MDNPPKKNILRISLAIAALSVPLLTAIALVYLSLFSDSTSKKLSLAREAMSASDKDKAFAIYEDIVLEDQTSEEAYIALAKLSEDRSNYKDSANFWMRASRLNPINKELRSNYFQSLAIAHGDDFLRNRYIADSDAKILSDELRFNVALAFLRGNIDGQREEIEKTLAETSYPKILRAYKDVIAGNLASAQRNLGEIIAQSKNPAELDYAYLLSGISALAEGNRRLAAEFASKMDDKHLATLSDKYILEGNIFMTEGNTAEAAKKYYEASRLQRYNPVILLESAELTFMNKNSEILEGIIGMTDTSSKSAIALVNYLKALNAGIASDWKHVVEFLEMSGPFSERTPAKLLKVQCAIEFDKPESAVAAVESLHAGEISRNTAEEMASALIGLLKKHLDNRGLSTAILQLSESNPAANSVKMLSSLEDGEYSDALEEAQYVLKALPNDSMAFSVAATSMMRLRDYDEVLKLTAEKLKRDPADVDAMVFAARARSAKGENKSAQELYQKALNQSDSSIYVAEEAGGFFVDNGLYSDLSKLVETLQNSKDKYKEALAYSLQGRVEKINKQYSKAVAFYEKSLKITPNVDSLYSEIAFCQLQEKNVGGAIKTLSEAAQKFNSPDLRFQLALILTDRGSKEDLEKALIILQALSREIFDNTKILTSLARVQFMSGKSEDSVISARRAVEISPRNPEALFTLARILFERKQYSGSVDLLERALSILPATPTKDLLVRALWGEYELSTTSAQKRRILERLKVLSPADPAPDKILKQMAEEEKKNGNPS